MSLGYTSAVAHARLVECGCAVAPPAPWRMRVFELALWRLACMHHCAVALSMIHDVGFLHAPGSCGIRHAPLRCGAQLVFCMHQDPVGSAPWRTDHAFSAVALSHLQGQRRALQLQDHGAAGCLQPQLLEGAGRPGRTRATWQVAGGERAGGIRAGEGRCTCMTFIIVRIHQYIYSIYIYIHIYTLDRDLHDIDMSSCVVSHISSYL